MAWLILLVAGGLEVVWATALRQSAGFTRLGPSLVGIAAAALSFVALAAALRQLPLGTAYVVWVGIGASGVVLIGMVHFGDPISPVRLVLVALVLMGAVGLRIVDG